MGVRILYILANEPTGGVGALVKSYTTRFSDAVIVDFLMYTAQRDTEFQKAVLNGKNKIYYLPELSLDFLGLRRKTDVFFREHCGEYDAVHLHFTGIGPICLPGAKKYGIPHIIVHSHNTKLSDNRLNNLRNKFLSDISLSYANHYMACSKDAAKYLYGTTDNVYYLNNAIDTELFRYNPSIRNDRDIKRFLFVGRLEPQKNPQFVIELFKRFVSDNPSSELLVAGIGRLEEKLKKAAEGYEGKIHFLGYREDIAALMNQSDYFLMPSEYEGLGITAVEAQSCGLKCLMSKNFPEEVDLTEMAVHLELKPELWIQQMKQDYIRQDYSVKIMEEGYSITEEVKKLESYYLDLKGK